MKSKRWLVVGLAVVAASALSVWAVDPIETFRTTAAVGTVFQSVNPLATNTPAFGFLPLAGHDFVNLALGTPLATTRTNEVLALEIDCASSQASLVVFDKTASSNLATIATSSSFAPVVQQDNPATAAPNRERFVAQMDINEVGFIVSGFLTVAGRIYLNPTNGCPRALLVDIDRGQDKLFADAKVKDTDDKDTTKNVSGFAHVIGVANVLGQTGSTNTFLIPFGRLNMRRQLAP